MYVFAAKLLDHLKSPIPFFGPNGDIIAAADRHHQYKINLAKSINILI